MYLGEYYGVVVVCPLCRVFLPLHIQFTYTKRIVIFSMLHALPIYICIPNTYICIGVTVQPRCYIALGECCCASVTRRYCIGNCDLRLYGFVERDNGSGAIFVRGNE